jgi:hypothetical protein
MIPKWLLEKSVIEDEEKSICEAIQAEGFECKVLDFASYMDDSAFLKLFDQDDCVVCYGSLQFASRIRRAAQWIPGVYCSLDAYECAYYYPRLGQCLLNEHYVMLPFGELERRKDFLFDTFDTNEIFIRPSSGFKLFTGKVVTRNSWEKDLKLFSFYDVDPERIVVAAPGRIVDREWRTVVVEGKIVAASLYMEKGEIKQSPGCPDDVWQYAQDVVDENNYDPDRAWTLDIADTCEGNRVIEVGAFSTSGLYECDWKAVAKAVSAAAMREWEEYQ